VVAIAVNNAIHEPVAVAAAIPGPSFAVRPEVCSAAAAVETKKAATPGTGVNAGDLSVRNAVMRNGTIQMPDV
jgi:hypothetical protein